MANFYGNCRSNYVRAKNPKRLKQILEEYDVNIIEQGELIGFVSTCEGGMPYHNELACDICDDQRIPKLLAEGETFIMLEIGSEKERYYIGYAVAVNHDGRQCHVNLNEIYSRAKAIFGTNPREASY